MILRNEKKRWYTLFKNVLAIKSSYSRSWILTQCYEFIQRLAFEKPVRRFYWLFSDVFVNFELILHFVTFCMTLLPSIYPDLCLRVFPWQYLSCFLDVLPGRSPFNFLQQSFKIGFVLRLLFDFYRSILK